MSISPLRDASFIVRQTARYLTTKASNGCSAILVERCFMPAHPLSIRERAIIFVRSESDLEFSKICRILPYCKIPLLL
jgi:hypothetical protein